MVKYDFVVFLYEVIIVGAGFVGSFVAYLLSRYGVSARVIEEDKNIGYPEHCAGLISFSGLRRLGILDYVRREGLVVNKIRRARVHAGGKSRIFNIRSTIVGVIDRPGLDNLIAGKAMDKGASFVLGKKVQKLLINGVKINTEYEDAKVIIDAEGAKRVLLRNFVGDKILESIPAMQMDINVGEIGDIDTVDIFFNVPDFFSWIIPLNHSTARIGVASKLIRNKYRFLRSLARRYFHRIREVKKFGGLVHVNGPYKKFTFGNIVGVGDAVGQTKPTTGGGVIIGGLSAAILANVIKKHLECGFPLKNYDAIWRRTFGTNIGFMMLLRRLLYSFDPSQILKFLLTLLPMKSIDMNSDFDFQLDLIL